MSHFYDVTSDEITKEGIAYTLNMERGYAKNFTITTTELEDGMVQADVLISGDGINYTEAIENISQSPIKINGEGTTRIENLPCVYMKIDVTNISGKWCFSIIGV